ALDLLAARAAEKGLELAYLLPADVPLHLLGDVSRLRQVLVNLVNNAIKFTPAGEVIVSLTAQPPLPELSHQIALQVAVKDTGIGIPADRLHRLFQPFSQVDASTTRQFGGTGLGLAISKRLCELMGGTLWVDSVEGQGSTFYFTLQAELDPHPPQSAHLCPATSLAGRHLLVVDDNATNRQILELQLQSWGVTVVAVESGAAALAALDQGQRFDLAVLDMQMPAMDGLMLAQTLNRRLPALPLVMLTSLGWSQGAQERDLFAAYLAKPVKQSQLMEALAAALADPAQPVRVAPRAAAPEWDTDLGRRCPKRILLAEDNVVNQKVALQILQRLGYRADVAASGLEVLAALEQQPYDLVLMDVQMPEMDGLEATRQIVARWPDRPRIVAMTANAMQGDRDLCLRAGVDDYISKPIRLEALIRVLAEPIPSSASAAPLAISSAVETAPAEPLAAAGAVDLPALQSFAATVGGSDPGFMADLIGSYLQSADQLVAEMALAHHHRDWATLQRAAHTLKSSSAAVSATGLAALCRELEATMRGGDAPVNPTALAAQIEAIQAAALEVKTLLNAALGSQEEATYARST
ncbi:MAG TPA: response regulator, partial [Nodosilinea sp.]|nr:response regulator [Nodosilinea sp.]